MPDAPIALEMVLPQEVPPVAGNMQPDTRQS